jgi:hypothetical protein
MPVLIVEFSEIIPIPSWGTRRYKTDPSFVRNAYIVGRQCSNQVVGGDPADYEPHPRQVLMKLIEKISPQS